MVALRTACSGKSLVFRCHLVNGDKIPELHSWENGLTVSFASNPKHTNNIAIILIILCCKRIGFSHRWHVVLINFMRTEKKGIYLTGYHKDTLRKKFTKKQFKKEPFITIIVRENVITLLLP